MKLLIFLLTLFVISHCFNLGGQFVQQQSLSLAKISTDKIEIKKIEPRPKPPTDRAKLLQYRIEMRNNLMSK